MKAAPAIDSAHHLLHLLGWSVGEGRFKLPDGSRYWQVDASRNGQVVIASADTQAMAWWEFCRMAGEVQKDGQYGQCVIYEAFRFQFKIVDSCGKLRSVC